MTTAEGQASEAVARARRQALRTFTRYKVAALADESTSPLRRVRLERNWTVEHLAEQALTARSTVEAADRGEPVSALTLRRIAAALGVSVEEIRPE